MYSAFPWMIDTQAGKTEGERHTLDVGNINWLDSGLNKREIRKCALILGGRAPVFTIAFGHWSPVSLAFRLSWVTLQ